jgi:DNA-binding response OmpR family regulator
MPPPPRILIVEDEPVLAENIKAYLGRRVLDVRMVSDGEHAIEILDRFAPDAVVMDYRLPGMNGLDTYTEMTRRQAKKIDCVMITGDTEARVAQRANERGIRSVLLKPFSFAELMERLDPPPPIG